jgi:hypothetical protein
MDHTEYILTNKNNKSKTNWNNEITRCLRGEPLYKSEYKLYSNSYTGHNWYHTKTSINKSNPVIESVRQKWQYHILKYLETKWIGNSTYNTSEGVVKQELNDD